MLYARKYAFMEIHNAASRMIQLINRLHKFHLVCADRRRSHFLFKGIPFFVVLWVIVFCPWQTSDDVVSDDDDDDDVDDDGLPF